MFRGQIHTNFPPEHPTVSFKSIEIKMAAVSVKKYIMCLTFAAAVLPATGNPIACSSSIAPKICIDKKEKIIIIGQEGSKESKLDLCTVSWHQLVT